MTINEYVREKRKEKKMTQTKLGAKVGVDRSTVCAYEKGNRGIPLEVLAAMANELDFDVNDALGTWRGKWKMGCDGYYP